MFGIKFSNKKKISDRQNSAEGNFYFILRKTLSPKKKDLFYTASEKGSRF